MVKESRGEKMKSFEDWWKDFDCQAIDCGGIGCDDICKQIRAETWQAALEEVGILAQGTPAEPQHGRKLETEERMTIKTVDVCPCGLIMHQLNSNDYDTLGSESGICCPDCGNENFKTIQQLLTESNISAKDQPSEPNKCSACNGTGDIDLSKPVDPSILDSANTKCRKCGGIGHKPEPKPLAQYLGEYIDYETELDTILSPRELLEQALDAYESTENVKIRIERNMT